MTKRILMHLTSALIWLPTVLNAVDTNSLIGHIESVPSAENYIYRLQDSTGGNMDCLKVFQPTGDQYAGVYYGVYHNLQKGILVAHLARSTDLRKWNHVTALDEHASQPTVHPCVGGQFLLAYERDEPNSCWIRVRYFKDLSALSMGKHQREFDISRTLAPTAEGTPSFESVKLGTNGVDTSEIQIRFHYFKNTHVDQLAAGTLTDFKSWEAKPLDEINSELIKGGWLGNLGDRDKFIWQDTAYYLQEIQKKKGDWRSWRTCLSDAKGLPFRTLSIQTHQGSTAFSNPAATWVTDSTKRKKLVVTLFLLSEGNPPAEVGTLLYVINPSETKTAPNQQLKATDKTAP